MRRALSLVSKLNTITYGKINRFDADTMNILPFGGISKFKFRIEGAIKHIITHNRTVILITKQQITLRSDTDPLSLQILYLKSDK